MGPLLHKLASQPQVASAYAADAPIRDPALARRVAELLRPLQVRRRTWAGALMSAGDTSGVNVWLWTHRVSGRGMLLQGLAVQYLCFLLLALSITTPSARCRQYMTFPRTGPSIQAAAAEPKPRRQRQGRHRKDARGAALQPGCMPGSRLRTCPGTRARYFGGESGHCCRDRGRSRGRGRVIETFLNASINGISDCARYRACTAPCAALRSVPLVQLSH